MESHKAKSAVTRTRNLNLVIRLNDREREMLHAVAAREQMSASETIRWLVRRAYEQTQIPDGDRVITTRSTVRPRKAK